MARTALDTGAATQAITDAVVAAGAELGLNGQQEYRAGRLRADVSLSPPGDSYPSLLVEIDNTQRGVLWNSQKYAELDPANVPVSLVSLRFATAAEPRPFLDPLSSQALPDFFISLNLDPSASDLQDRVRDTLENILTLPNALQALSISGVEAQYEHLLRFGSGRTLVISHLQARERLATFLFNRHRLSREALAIILGAQFSVLRRSGDYRRARAARARLSRQLGDYWQSRNGLSGATTDILRRNDALSRFNDFADPDAHKLLHEGSQQISSRPIKMSLYWREALTAESSAAIRHILARYRDEADISPVTVANVALAKTLWMLRARPKSWKALALAEAYQYFAREWHAWNAPGHGGTYHGVLAGVYLVATVLCAVGEASVHVRRWLKQLIKLMSAGNVSADADGFREIAVHHDGMAALRTRSRTRVTDIRDDLRQSQSVEKCIRQLAAEIDAWFQERA